MKTTPLLIAGLLMSLGAVAADMRTVTLDVSKMDCAVCPVDLKTRRAVIAFDPAKTSTEALTRATADAGFPSSVQQVQ